MSTTSRSRRGNGDEGAAIVEAALVMPLVLFFLMGIIDLGFAAFQSVQASAAARDGSRRAILWPDDPTGAQYTATVSAVRSSAVSHLDVPSIVPAGGFSVSCIRPDGSAVSCGAAEPGQDRVVTSVSWSYRPLTFVGTMFPITTITGRSTMYLLGASMRELSASPTSTTSTIDPSSTTTTTGDPSTTTTTLDPSTTTTTTAPPPPTTELPTTTSTSQAPPTTIASCMVSLSFNPASGSLQGGSGKLRNDIAVTATVNGTAYCGALTLRYSPGNNATTQTINLSHVGTTTTYTGTISGTSGTWVGGAHSVQAYSNGAAVATAPASFRIT